MTLPSSVSNKFRRRRLLCVRISDERNHAFLVVVVRPIVHYRCTYPHVAWLMCFGLLFRSPPLAPGA